MRKFLLKFIAFTVGLSVCSCGDNGTINSELKQDTKLTNSYTITWKNYDGSILEVDTKVEEGTIPCYDGITPTKASSAEHNFLFKGWSPSVVEATNDATYIAVYTESINSYTITWKNYDGSVLETDLDVPYGITPTYDGMPPVKISDNQYSYTWTGWSPNIEQVTSNATYIATFEKSLINAKVNFDLDGGSSNSYEGSVYMPRIDSRFFFFDVFKDGFNFRGWSLNGEKVFDNKRNQLSYPKLTSEMTFKAIYAKTAELNISSNLPNAGEIVGAGEYSFNQQVSIRVFPYKGYQFIGWYFKGICISTEQTYNYMMWNEDITLDAVFKYDSFSLSILSYNADYGNVLIQGKDSLGQTNSSKSFLFKENVVISSITTSDARFLGWFLPDGSLVSPSAYYSFEMPNDNYTLIAKWDRFNLDLHSNTGGKVFGEGVYCSNEKVSIKACPDSHYHFEGWYLNGNLISQSDELIITMPYENVYYVAKFALNEYIVSINNENTNAGEIYGSGNYVYGSIITITAIPYDGYNFVGWYDKNNDLVTSSTTYTFTLNGENEEFVAKFKSIEYSITTNLNGGTLNDAIPETYNIETPTIDLPIPTKEGYAFEGWSNGTKIIESIPAGSIGNLSLTAIWSINSYEIETKPLDTNMGSTTGSGLYLFNADVTVSAKAYPGFVFDGWYLNNTMVSLDMNYTFKAPANHLVLAAKFKSIEYSITTNLNGGTLNDAIPETYNIETPTIDLPIPTKEGYAFEGWSNGTKIIESIPAGSIGNLSLTAIWSFLYELKVQSEDENMGIVTGSGKFKSGTKVTLAAIPSKGYIFEGWYVDNNKVSSSSEYEIEISNSNLTFLAKWDIKYNEYILEISEGVCDIKKVTISYNKEYELPLPSNGKKNFIGWTLHGEIIPLKGIWIYSDSNDTLVAKWGNGEFGFLKYGMHCGVSMFNPNGDTIVNIPNIYDGLPVDEIGYNAFFDLSSLISITIPDSISSIGVIAFYGCTSLSSIVIPKNVTFIGSWAFSNCPSLNIFCEATSMPSSWDNEWNLSNRPVYWGFKASLNYDDFSFAILNNSAKDYAVLFESIDNNVVTVKIPTTLKIGANLIPVTSIGDYAFYNCSSLTSIEIPKAVNYIGDYAFYNCSSLTSIEIPKAVNYIGDYTFYNCSSLTSIIIPEGVSSIGDYTFYNCSSLTSIIIPEGVSSIGDYAFYNCSSLTSIEIPKAVNYIGKCAFNYCSSLTSIIIPEGVTFIGEGAFLNCVLLTSIIIPEGVSSIGDNAFNYCSSLTSIEIPKTVNYIGDRAFNYCSSLTSIIIPEGVTFIGERAFYNCSSLTSIIIPEGVTFIGERAFYNCSSLIIFCEVASMPSSWNIEWNLTNIPVYWGIIM